MQNSREVRDQIDAVNQITGLSRFVIEKDLYVTQVISIVNNIQSELYDLVFQGGTSLAKAHRIIERMSEDCDFRIRLKPDVNEASKNYKRKVLKTFRHNLVAGLKEKGFNLEDEDIRVRNEGQYMALRAHYPSMFPTTNTLKPYLALEFFLAEVKLQPELKPVTTLIKQILQDKVSHPEFPIQSVAIMETAAEKWVGLTRRVATSQQRSHYRDPNLVRHLYDLYKINELGYFNSNFIDLVPRIVLDDRQHYKNHNNKYYKDPAGEIKRAVEELAISNEWHENWDQFVDAMVFAKQKPSYHDVLENLHEKTNLALDELNKHKFECDAPVADETKQQERNRTVSPTLPDSNV